MTIDKKPIKVVVLTKDSEIVIVSTLLLIQSYIKIKLGFEPNILVIDNHSKDRTLELLEHLDVEVIHHYISEPWSAIVKEALEIGKSEDIRTLVIIDLKGGNDADDVISLINRSILDQDLFASGYILPQSNPGGIGCWAIDKGLLTKMDGDSVFDIEKKMIEMTSKEDLEVQNVREWFKKNSKKTRRNVLRSLFNNPLSSLNYFFKNHPLTIFGGLGIVVLLVASGTVFYTIDYFYKYNHLNYFPAFVTIALVMIGGFLMVAGLMLNALNVLVERLEAVRKWVK